MKKLIAPALSVCGSTVFALISWPAYALTALKTAAPPRPMLRPVACLLVLVGFLLIGTAPLSACAQSGCEREAEVARGAAIPNLAEIDAAVQRAMVEWNVPGLALAIVKDGKPLLVKGYGVRDATKKEPVTPETIFGLLSPTKSFTATAIAMLVDEGRISWDDPVERYLPEFKLPASDASEPLRVRDLVSHASGYVDDHSLWYRSPLTRNQIVARAPKLKRPFAAGEKFNYNNTMFIAAGTLIERVSGQTWEEFIQSRFFDPLEMDRSVIGDDALSGVSNVASPHVPRFLRRFGAPTPTDYIDVDVVGPAGAIHTSADDMVSWLQFNLNLGEYRGQRLVSAEALKKLWEPQVRMPSVPGYLCGIASSESYGSGWYILDYRGHKMMMHGGGVRGQRAAVGLVPSQKLGIAVLSNMHETEIAQQLVFAISDMFLGAEPEEWSNRF